MITNERLNWLLANAASSETREMAEMIGVMRQQIVKLNSDNDQAISSAVQAERDRIAEAAQPFIDWSNAIPNARHDDLGIGGIQYLGDNGKVKDILITVGDLRKLSAAIRARGKAKSAGL